MFRVGTTSYIISADILPNVEFLASRVDDIQLVLFETDEYGSNLPDAALCRRLAALASTHGLTYTVHLPLDLALAGEGDELSISLRKAQRVIDATRTLTPEAYTLHLDGTALPAADAFGLAQWQDRACRALEAVCVWVDDPRRLCIENVERWDPELLAPILERLPVSRTVDIGHLWLQGQDPLLHLNRWLPRTRVVHLHGIAERDHRSLAALPPAQLEPVVRWLEDAFSGVVTLEVFSEEDFTSSLAILNRILQRPYRKEDASCPKS